MIGDAVSIVHLDDDLVVVHKPPSVPVSCYYFYNSFSCFLFFVPPLYIPAIETNWKPNGKISTTSNRRKKRRKKIPFIFHHLDIPLVPSLFAPFDSSEHVILPRNLVSHVEPISIQSWLWASIGNPTQLYYYYYYDTTIRIPTSTTYRFPSWLEDGSVCIANAGALLQVKWERRQRQQRRRWETKSRVELPLIPICRRVPSSWEISKDNQQLKRKKSIADTPCLWLATFLAQTPSTNTSKKYVSQRLHQTERASNSLSIQQ